MFAFRPSWCGAPEGLAIIRQELGATLDTLKSKAADGKLPGPRVTVDGEGDVGRLADAVVIVDEACLVTKELRVDIKAHAEVWIVEDLE